VKDASFTIGYKTLSESQHASHKAQLLEKELQFDFKKFYITEKVFLVCIHLIILLYYLFTFIFQKTKSFRGVEVHIPEVTKEEISQYKRK